MPPGAPVTPHLVVGVGRPSSILSLRSNTSHQRGGSVHLLRAASVRCADLEPRYRGTPVAFAPSMPSATDILAQLTTAANEMMPLALAWHVLIALVAAAMLGGWRPPDRHAAWLLIGPALSVCFVWIAYEGWFNAVSFGLLASALALLTPRRGAWRVRGSTWSLALGCALTLYGFVYPHFVEGAWYRTLYAAPVGVAPCPTLAILAGFALVTGAGESRRTPVVLAVWTAFYAAYGILKLGVILDVGLVVATVGLVLLAVSNPRHERRHPGAHGVGTELAHGMR